MGECCLRRSEARCGEPTSYSSVIRGGGEKEKKNVAQGGVAAAAAEAWTTRMNCRVQKNRRPGWQRKTRPPLANSRLTLVPSVRMSAALQAAAQVAA